MKHFYSHLVSIESVHIELSYLDMSDEEQKHLSDLSESNLHHMILNAVLSELSHEDKKVFLRQFHLDDHTGIWRFLNKKSNNIEKLIKKTGEEFIKKLHEDIQEAKKK